MIIFFSFIVGACIGSFLNVCIYRIPREESLIFNSSHCINCGEKIKWYDLIPILSYVFLRGKCRKCNERISIFYPLIELITAIVYVLLYLKYGISLEFLKACTIISLLIVISVIDLKTKFIYRSTIIFGLVSGSIFFVVECINLEKISWQYILGFIIGYLLIKVIVVCTNSMGEGDIDLAIICGLYFGVKGILAILLISFILGAVIGIYLITTKKKDRRYEMAFAPYIMVASIVFCLYGNEIVKWYTNMFI